MTSIGIIGAGVAGLHLGLWLRAYGVDTTIYTEKTADQLEASRLANIVIRFGPMRQRERLLGVDYWDSPAHELCRYTITVNGARPVAFSGATGEPTNAVDMRIYCARLLRDFTARGGQVRLGTMQAGDLARLGAAHNLLVVATGRGGLANLFPRVPEHCPFDAPQRIAIGGLFRGVAYPQPVGFDVIANPGHGEILAIPFHSFEPGLTGVAFEIIPGGAFAALQRVRYADDPDLFHTTFLGLLRQYAPTIYARVDCSAFALSRPLDLGYAAITPTVRQGFVPIAGKKFAIAIGDAYVLNDPITGQGANMAAHAAWVLGEAIRDANQFDQTFCQRVERQLWAYAQPVSEACNARLVPPSPQMIQFTVAAAQHQPIADTYALNLHHPDQFWTFLSSPERTAEFLAQHGWASQAPSARAA